MRPPRSQNDPLLSLVGGVVFGLVVEVQCPSDYFRVGDIEGFSLLPHPIKGVLRKANRQGWVFDVHSVPLICDVFNQFKRFWGNVVINLSITFANFDETLFHKVG